MAFDTCLLFEFLATSFLQSNQMLVNPITVFTKRGFDLCQRSKKCWMCFLSLRGELDGEAVLAEI